MVSTFLGQNGSSQAFATIASFLTAGGCYAWRVRYASGLCSIVWILASPLSSVSANAGDWVLLCEGQRLVIDLDHKTVGGIFWGRTSPFVDVTDKLTMWRQEWGARFLSTHAFYLDL
jgi:hypothetical protein